MQHRLHYRSLLRTVKPVLLHIANRTLRARRPKFPLTCIRDRALPCTAGHIRYLYQVQRPGNLPSGVETSIFSECKRQIPVPSGAFRQASAGVSRVGVMAHVARRGGVCARAPLRPAGTARPDLICAHGKPPSCVCCSAQKMLDN